MPTTKRFVAFGYVWARIWAITASRVVGIWIQMTKTPILLARVE